MKCDRTRGGKEPTSPAAGDLANLFAGVPVSDVGDEVLWDLDEHATLFIEPNAAQAGAGRITLGVVWLDALLERLAAQRIEPEADGNAIAFAEMPG